MLHLWYNAAKNIYILVFKMFRENAMTTNCKFILSACCITLRCKRSVAMIFWKKLLQMEEGVGTPRTPSKYFLNFLKVDLVEFCCSVIMLRTAKIKWTGNRITHKYMELLLLLLFFLSFVIIDVKLLMLNLRIIELSIQFFLIMRVKKILFIPLFKDCFSLFKNIKSKNIWKKEIYIHYTILCSFIYSLF